MQRFSPPVQRDNLLDILKRRGSFCCGRACRGLEGRRAGMVIRTGTNVMVKFDLELGLSMVNAGVRLRRFDKHILVTWT